MSNLPPPSSSPPPPPAAPSGAGEVEGRPPLWKRRWFLITAGALLGLSVISATGGDADEEPQTAVPADDGQDPAVEGATEAAATTEGTTTTATTESPTTTTIQAPEITTTTPTTEPPTTTTPFPTIPSGTYAVGSEITPGTYRVAGYWATLDGNLDIIENDGVYNNGLSLMVIVPEAEFVEISGEAISLATGPLDVLELGFTEGTYRVGGDIEPGRYRVSDETYAYAARHAADLDIIDNEGNAGSVVIDVAASDYAFTFSGVLERLD